MRIYGKDVNDKNKEKGNINIEGYIQSITNEKHKKLKTKKVAVF